jgi:hypothetical protein
MSAWCRGLGSFALNNVHADSDFALVCWHLEPTACLACAVRREGSSVLMNPEFTRVLKTQIEG